jgi:hypothetical protein
MVILPVVLYECAVFLSHWEKDIDWGCLRTEFWATYVDLRDSKWQKSGYSYIIWSFIICNLHKILLGWSNQGGIDRWAYSMHDKMKSTYNISICKPQVKRPSMKPECRWWDNIKVNRKGIWCGGMERIHMAQDTVQWQAVVNMVWNLKVTYKS